MTDWRQLLRDGDPGSDRVDTGAIEAVRATIVREARVNQNRVSWRMTFALAAFACLVLTVSVVGTRRPATSPSAGHPPAAGTERRQIQFATPGGTRIVWEINPNFTLGEAVP